MEVHRHRNHRNQSKRRNQRRKRKIRKRAPKVHRMQKMPNRVEKTKEKILLERPLSPRPNQSRLHSRWAQSILFNSALSFFFSLRFFQIPIHHFIIFSISEKSSHSRSRLLCFAPQILNVNCPITHFGNQISKLCMNVICCWKNENAKEALPRKKRDVFRERERERSLSIQQVRDFVCVNLIGMRVMRFSNVTCSCVIAQL